MQTSSLHPTKRYKRFIAFIFRGISDYFTLAFCCGADNCDQRRGGITIGIIIGVVVSFASNRRRKCRCLSDARLIIAVAYPREDHKPLSCQTAT
jgi:hypothetical protein